MKLYGGIDLHSNNSVFSIKDETGDVMARRKLPNDMKQIFLFLAPFKDQLTGFKFNDYFFYKTLVIYYTSRHDHKRNETFNVTLVSRKKRKYIKQSIRKIIKQNQNW